MRRFVPAALALALASAGCSGKQDDPKPKTQTTEMTARASSGAPAARPHRVDQQPPPSGIDIAHPPADAIKKPNGMIFKSLKDGDGPSPGKNDTVMITYTGWRPNGETMYSTKSRGKPTAMPLANTAIGFAEAMTMMKKGGRAIFWLPPDIGYKGTPQGTPETLAFEVELIDITPAPPVPADVAAPPTDARKTDKGVFIKTLTPGTGKDKLRFYDLATISFTAWDSTGRMFDSTETRGQPRPSAPYRETPGLESALTQMRPGERARIWIPGELNQPSLNAPAGMVCYELTLVSVTAQHAPPPTPKDVAAPPKDAQKTALGVFYKVLKPSTATQHPAATDQVKVHYTGWTSDGRMFDSSFVRDKPADFAVTSVMKGWTDGLQIMSPGEQVRFWIPAELANKGQPGRPQGMLTFDVELLEIKPGAPPHGHP
jgi:peptidylprolyl isomerase